MREERPKVNHRTETQLGEEHSSREDREGWAEGFENKHGMVISGKPRQKIKEVFHQMHCTRNEDTQKTTT